MAAGSLLALEAGGLVADFRGEQDWMASGNVLAAGPKMLAQMLSYLRN
jgi:myo-inositol-1(or 4)-monophosphatase